MAVAERELAREVRRLFRRFDETGAYVARLAEGDYGLFVARNRWRRPVLRLDARIWRDMEARDLVTCRETRENAGIWIPSEAGRAWYRRLEAAAAGAPLGAGPLPDTAELRALRDGCCEWAGRCAPRSPQHARACGAAAGTCTRGQGLKIFTLKSFH